MNTAQIAKQRLMNSSIRFNTDKIADFFTEEKTMTNMDYKKIAIDIYDALHQLIEDVIMSQDEATEVDLNESIANAYAVADRYDDVLI